MAYYRTPLSRESGSFFRSFRSAHVCRLSLEGLGQGEPGEERMLLFGKALVRFQQCGDEQRRCKQLHSRGILKSGFASSLGFFPAPEIPDFASMMTSPSMRPPVTRGSSANRAAVG